MTYIYQSESIDKIENSC